MDAFVAAAALADDHLPSLMPRSQRRLSKLLTIAALAIGLFVFGPALATGHPVLAALGFIATITPAVWELTLRCDHCGHVMARHTPSYPFERPRWMGMKRRCLLCHCGRPGYIARSGA
jgi:hypothetical protein